MAAGSQLQRVEAYADAARLAVPDLPPWVLSRRRLEQRLTDGVDGPLTLIAAGAGSGKTVLMSSWLHQGGPGLPTAWLALDSSHATRSRFWSAALASLRAAGGVERGELAELAPPQESSSGDQFAARFVAALSELPEPLVLVIDDLHELTSREALLDLAYVLTYGAARLRVVAAARREPALPLHRLRLSGGLTELRMAELAFSPEEAAELFAVLGQPLTASLAERLWQRTEGWAAGLRIAALSARGEEDIAAFVDAFAGDDRALVDYVVAEVLAKQPVPVREFLLRTCIVDELGPDLADALTGRTDGARMLAELERANAFVTRVPVEGHPYRYHQLMAELVQGQLRREAPDEVPALHRRASDWYAAAGRPLPAIDHALEARDWAGAASLLGEHWVTLYLEGAGRSVRELFDRLPREQLTADPELAVTVAAARLMAGDAPAAEPYLRVANEGREQVAPDERRRFEISLAVAQLLHARLTGQLQRATEVARAVLQPTGERPWHYELTSDDKQAVALLNVGLAELWAGGRLASGDSLRSALEIARRRGRDYIELEALGGLAALLVMESRLREGHETGTAALDLAERRGWSNTPAAALALLAMVGVDYNRDRLADASRRLQRAETALAGTGEPTLLASLHYLNGLLHAARGERDAAIARCRQARAMASEVHDEHFLALPALWVEAHQLINVDRDDEAAALLSSFDGEPRPAEVRVPMARLKHRAGDTDGALELLTPALDRSAPFNHVQILLDVHLAAAAIHDDAGDVGGSMRCLEAALELAEPEGYVRVFVDQGGPQIRERLERQVRLGTAHRALVGDVLDRLDGNGGADQEQVPELTEPLSAREIDVLRYLPTSLQAAEIAAELFVSVNTVRTHVKNIYRKLGAQRRAQAVARARALRLLGPDRTSRG
jgi:LuxR family transcriptional regulator, maltose regulon positive regulatory protein